MGNSDKIHYHFDNPILDTPTVLKSDYFFVTQTVDNNLR